MGAQMGDIPDGYSLHNEVPPRKLPKPTDIDKVKKTIKQTSDHPDVLDEILDRLITDPSQESIPSARALATKYSITVDQAKQQILSHYRSVEEIEVVLNKAFATGVEKNESYKIIRQALGLEGSDG